MFIKSMSFRMIRGYVFSITTTLFLSLCIGCTNLNTVGNVGNTIIEGLGDVNIFTDAEELQFGQAFVAEHDKKVTVYKDQVVTNYINDLGQSLVRYSKRSNISYRFKVINTDVINAYAVPGGFIYVNLGLIRAVRSESELAFVLGHEIGHIVGQHSMKRLTQVYGIELIKQIILDEDASEVKKIITEILAIGLLFRYSRDDERESDYYGVQNVYDAGISPEGGMAFFETLHKLRGREASSLEKLISTHPMPKERIDKVRSQINGLPRKSGLRTDSSRFQQVKRRIR